MINITKVDVYNFNDEDRNKLGLNGNVLARASIMLGFDFAVHNILLLTGEKGYYLLFPKDKVGKGVAYPINNDIREEILNLVVSVYESYLD